MIRIVKLATVSTKALHSLERSIVGVKDDTRFPWRAGGTLYIASFGLQFLFLRAYFWDDWTVYASRSKNETTDFFSSIGSSPLHAPIQVDLLNRNPAVFHVLTFLFFFLGGVLVFKILRTIPYLSAQQSRMITLFFLVLPINSARVVMAVFNYSYSFLFFLFGWYLLTSYKSKLIRLSSTLFFLASFSTLSLLTFFFLPVIHLYLQLRKQSVDGRAMFVCFAFALIAPAYWYFSRTVLPPASSARLDYLTPTFSGICRAFLLMTPLLIGVTRSLSKKSGANQDFRKQILWFGAFATGCGASAYVTSGRLVDVSEWMLNFVPRGSDWDSRHQLLLGLGLSVVIVGLFGPLNTTFKRSAVIVCLLLCVSLNVLFMQSYYLDSLKQNETLQLFQSSSEVRESKVIMIEDNAKVFNARGRGVRSYEWEGMLRSLFGSDNKKVIYATYVDCGSPGAIIPDVRAIISSTNGRMRALLTGKIDLQMSVEKIKPCD
jgi:hypothetical protein